MHTPSPRYQDLIERWLGTAQAISTLFLHMAVVHDTQISTTHYDMVPVSLGVCLSWPILEDDGSGRSHQALSVEV